MSEPEQELQERLREAVAKGGPDAAFAVLSEAGFAIDREPEPGVGMRMRFGAGTDEGFTTTMYSPSPDRPAGWPAGVPFLPGTGGSVTLFEHPDRGPSIQWFQVPDPAAAVQTLVDQSLATGWHRVDTPPSRLPPHLVPGQLVVLERGERRRTLLSVVSKGFGMVQLVEKGAGQDRGGPTARPGS